MFRNLIWDFDGTLFDTYPAITTSVQVALRKQKVSAHLPEILSLCKITLQTALDHYQSLHHLDMAQLRADYAAYYESLPLDTIKPYPGLHEVLDFCRLSGRTNYIVTHRPLYMIKAHLGHFNLDGYFADFVTSDDMYPRKPDPAAFLALKERYDLPEVLSLAIGDRDLDIYAARGAGFKTCLFQNPDTTIPADFFLDDLHQLTDLIR